MTKHSAKDIETVAAPIKDAFYAARDSGRTMHQAADDAARAILDMALPGTASDGYHTFNELYRYRLLFHAAYINSRHRLEVDWLNYRKSINPDFEPVPTTVKSWRHSDGEECFGGGWFIVVTALPTGQISNHYEADHWTLFEVPEVETAPEWDGHTPAQAAARLEELLRRA